MAFIGDTTLQSSLPASAAQVLRLNHDSLQTQITAVANGTNLIPGSNFVSMRSLGATGLPSQDATGAFKAAAKAGGSYMLESGAVYSVSASTLMTVAGTKFWAPGWGAIIRQIGSSFHCFHVLANNCQFEGIQFQGGAVAETAIPGNIGGSFAIYTISTTPVSKGRVINCLFSGPNSTTGFNNGVKVDAGCNFWTVHNNHFERLVGNSGNGFGYGVLLGATNRSHITENLFEGSKTTAVVQGRHAVYTSSGASANYIAGNVVENFNSSSFAIYSTSVETACADNLLTGNEVRNQALSTDGTAAFELTGNIKNNVIRGNLVIDCARDGVIVTDAGSGGLNKFNSIVGNRIVRVGYEGVDIRGAKGTFVDWNCIEDCSQSSSGTYAAIAVRRSDDTTQAANGTIIGNDNVATASNLGSVTHRCLVRLDPSAPAPTNTAISLTFQNASIPGGSGVVDDNSVAFSWYPGGPQQALTGEYRASNNVVALSARNAANSADYNLAKLTSANQIDYGDTQNAGVFLRAGSGGFIRPVINSVTSSTFTDTVVQLNLISGNYTAEISSGDVVLRDNAGNTVFRSGTAGIGFFGHTQSGQLSTLTGKKDGSDGNLLCQQIADLCKTFGLTTNNGT